MLALALSLLLARLWTASAVGCPPGDDRFSGCTDCAEETVLVVDEETGTPGPVQLTYCAACSSGSIPNRLINNDAPACLSEDDCRAQPGAVVDSVGAEKFCRDRLRLLLTGCPTDAGDRYENCQACGEWSLGYARLIGCGMCSSGVPNLVFSDSWQTEPACVAEDACEGKGGFLGPSEFGSALPGQCCRDPCPLRVLEEGPAGSRTCAACEAGKCSECETSGEIYNELTGAASVCISRTACEGTTDALVDTAEGVPVCKNRITIVGCPEGDTKYADCATCGEWSIGYARAIGCAMCQGSLIPNMVFNSDGAACVESSACEGLGGHVGKTEFSNSEQIGDVCLDFCSLAKLEDHCTSCDDGTGACLDCSSGFTLNEGTGLCEEGTGPSGPTCPADDADYDDCDVCSGSGNALACDTCKPGFLHNELETGPSAVCISSQACGNSNGQDDGSGNCVAKTVPCPSECECADNDGECTSCTDSTLLLNKVPGSTKGNCITEAVCTAGGHGRVDSVKKTCEASSGCPDEDRFAECGRCTGESLPSGTRYFCDSCSGGKLPNLVTWSDADACLADEAACIAAGGQKSGSSCTNTCNAMSIMTMVNCVRCDSSNTGTCIRCVTGYYVNKLESQAVTDVCVSLAICEANGKVEGTDCVPAGTPDPTCPEDCECANGDGVCTSCTGGKLLNEVAGTQKAECLSKAECVADGHGMVESKGTPAVAVCATPACPDAASQPLFAGCETCAQRLGNNDGPEVTYCAACEDGLLENAVPDSPKAYCLSAADCTADDHGEVGEGEDTGKCVPKTSACPSDDRFAGCTACAQKVVGEEEEAVTVTYCTACSAGIPNQITWSTEPACLADAKACTAAGGKPDADPATVCLDTCTENYLLEAKCLSCSIPPGEQYEYCSACAESGQIPSRLYGMLLSGICVSRDTCSTTDGTSVGRDYLLDAPEVCKLVCAAELDAAGCADCAPNPDNIVENTVCMACGEGKFLNTLPSVTTDTICLEEAACTAAGETDTDNGVAVCRARVCADAGCETCSSEEPGSCTKCSGENLVNKLGSPTFTDVCVTLQQCTDNQGKKNNNNCVPMDAELCDPDCECAANDGVCTSCKDGKFLNKLESQAVTDVCLDRTTCETHGKVEGTDCVPNNDPTPQPTKCPAGGRFESDPAGAWKCTACASLTVGSETATYCTSCDDGFSNQITWSDAAACVAPTGCTAAGGKMQGFTACVDTCSATAVVAHPHCVRCDSGGETCTKCAGTYYLNQLESGATCLTSQGCTDLHGYPVTENEVAVCSATAPPVVCPDECNCEKGSDTCVSCKTGYLNTLTGVPGNCFADADACKAAGGEPDKRASDNVDICRARVCADDDCETCSDEQAGSCTKCSGENLVNKLGSGTFTTVCVTLQQCTDNQGKKSGNDCVPKDAPEPPCDPDCECAANDGVCTSCKDGKLLNELANPTKKCLTTEECGTAGGVADKRASDQVDICRARECKVENCEVCADEIYETCTKCASGYLLNNMANAKATHKICLDAKDGDEAACTAVYGKLDTSGEVPVCVDTCSLELIGQNCLHCDAQGACDLCFDDLYLNKLGSGAACLSAGDCDTRGGIPETQDGKNVCRARPCADPNCGECRDGNAGSCTRCSGSYLLNRLPGATTECLENQGECRAEGGEPDTEGSGSDQINVCQTRKCADTDCLTCRDEEEGSCTRCAGDRLLNVATSTPAVQALAMCVPEDACRAAGGRPGEVEAEPGHSVSACQDNCTMPLINSGCQLCQGEGEAVRCAVCAKGLTLAMASGGHSADLDELAGQCVEAGMCPEVGGTLLDLEGEVVDTGAAGFDISEYQGTCVDLEACKGRDPLCAACSAGPAHNYQFCSSCGENLEDHTWGAPGPNMPLSCMAAEDCTGTLAVEDVEGREGVKACVALPCADVEGCTACDPKNASACAACDTEAYGLRDGACVDDCIAGPHAVPHCGACHKSAIRPRGGGRDGEDDAPDTIYCRACAEGYKPAETEPMGEPGADPEADPEAEAPVRVLSCKKDGLSAGAIAGIVIAVVVVVALVVFLCVYFLVCRKRKQTTAVV